MWCCQSRTLTWGHGLVKWWWIMMHEANGLPSISLQKMMSKPTKLQCCHRQYNSTTTQQQQLSRFLYIATTVVAVCVPCNSSTIIMYPILAFTALADPHWHEASRPVWLYSLPPRCMPRSLIAHWRGLALPQPGECHLLLYSFLSYLRSKICSHSAPPEECNKETYFYFLRGLNSGPSANLVVGVICWTTGCAVACPTQQRCGITTVSTT